MPAKKPYHVDVEGVFYLIPYSGLAEVINETGLSVFWFAPDLTTKLLPCVGKLVKATYLNTLEATRRVMGTERPEEYVQLVAIKCLEAPQEVPTVMREVFKTMRPIPLCWLTECGNYAAKGSAYCEGHTKELKEQQNG